MASRLAEDLITSLCGDTLFYRKFEATTAVSNLLSAIYFRPDLLKSSTVSFK